MDKQIINSKGDVLRFGRYKGRTVEYILNENPSYVIWMHDEGFKIATKIYDEACALDSNNSYPEDFVWNPDD